MISALTSLSIYSRNLPKMQAATAADPSVKRETGNFLANIKSISTSADFVSNTRVFTYAMQAYGLGDMTYAKSFMQKLLDGGVSNSKSLANTLTDPRFKAFVKAYDFGDLGAQATSFDNNNTTTTQNYVEQTIESSAGQQNQGAQLALYFQHQAPNITSGLQIMADKALFQFVQTAFNIPTLTATDSASLDKEAALIESRVKIADLNNPAKVQAMITRFAVMYDVKNTDPAASSPALALLSGSSNGSASSNLVLTAIKLYSQF